MTGPVRGKGVDEKLVGWAALEELQEFFLSRADPASSFAMRSVN